MEIFTDEKYLVTRPIDRFMWDFYPLKPSEARSAKITIFSTGFAVVLNFSRVANDAEEVARLIRPKLIMDLDGYSLCRKNALMCPLQIWKWLGALPVKYRVFDIPWCVSCFAIKFIRHYLQFI
ncbi:hypothetical protein EVAR_37740_1 [Eumeta japonica]|uniref:Uncharacterized protein n=1 Tax=Eumeta variegata TaxID=151549 RepID=A0A4C1WMV7_EUMVA|nr:hypothetical protein EVAR_37740_1 [Eumeta japonica]